MACSHESGCSGTAKAGHNFHRRLLSICLEWSKCTCKIRCMRLNGSLTRTLRGHNIGYCVTRWLACCNLYTRGSPANLNFQETLMVFFVPQVPVDQLLEVIFSQRWVSTVSPMALELEQLRIARENEKIGLLA